MAEKALYIRGVQILHDNLENSSQTGNEQRLNEILVKEPICPQGAERSTMHTGLREVVFSALARLNMIVPNFKGISEESLKKSYFDFLTVDAEYPVAFDSRYIGDEPTGYVFVMALGLRARASEIVEQGIIPQNVHNKSLILCVSTVFRDLPLQKNEEVANAQ